MEFEKIKSEAETIAMPEEMKRRIVRNCKLSARKEYTMKTNVFRKSAAVLAAVVLCLSLSVTALADTEILKGFFRDLTNWQGAVVGTSYEQATDEINVRTEVNGKELIVLATFVNPEMIPYKYTEKLGIAAYKILDVNCEIVKEGTAESTEVVNGQAAVTIQLDDLDSGNYKLVVTAFVSEKKADQPLTINGSWECIFAK